MHDQSQARERLLETLRLDGICDETVLAAMASVPRDRFVPLTYRSAAWENHPLPIGSGQTISQPYIVAYMTQTVGVHRGDNVLDVGTGCGYQAAVLAACGASVTSIEVRPELADEARRRLERLGYAVDVVLGDGSLGAPDRAPFDAIVVAAAADSVPTALVEQLRAPAPERRGGRLIIPVASGWGQVLVLIEATATGPRRTELLSVRFVPMVGHG